MTYIIALGLLALLLTVAEAIKVRYLSRCHFGILAPAALRWRLRIWQLLRRPCAVIALDVRKLHDLNEVIGYSTANELISNLVRERYGRRRDLIGQFGGDEFVIALSDHEATGRVLRRLTERLEAITGGMPIDVRFALARRTGGLVDGLHAAIAIVPYTEHAYDAAVRAVDGAGAIKAGEVTNCRSTSGRAGTIVEVLA